jgi:hypothetical protein
MSFLVDHLSPLSTKGIHKLAYPTAYDAAQWPCTESTSDLVGDFIVIGSHRLRYRTDSDTVSTIELMGRLIRHARLRSTLTVGALAVSMIKASFRGLLVTAVGRTSLFAAGFAATAVGTVTLSTITGTADIENATASLRATKRMTENNFRCVGHPRPKAGLDNSHQSWQLGAIRVDGVSDMSRQQRTSVVTAAGVFFHPPQEKHYTVTKR